MLGMISVVLLCSYLGLLLYAFYFECDPVSSGIVDSSDQLLPLFVADALRNYPSLPGKIFFELHKVEFKRSRKIDTFFQLSTIWN